MNKFQFKGVKFLIAVVAIYIAIALLEFHKMPLILHEFVSIWKELLPIFALVILLTTFINFLLKPKHIIKHLGKDSGVMGVVYALLGGILSHGPMYAWYGMLSDFRKQGLTDGLIAVFLYARAVKLPLLPFMISLFGMTFTIVINILILLFAVLQGKMVDLLMESK